MIRPATKLDNSLQLAKLVYSTDNIIPFIFGKEERAISILQTLIRNEDTSFSYRNIILFEEDNREILGILLAFNPSSIDKQKENEAFSKSFDLSELVSIWFKSLLLSSISNKSEIKGLYIQNISVNQLARGKGVGTKLIEFIENRALQQGFDSLWLDVAFDNFKARKLYERQGFRVVSKKGIFFSKDGFFRMRKDIVRNAF